MRLRATGTLALGTVLLVACGGAAAQVFVAAEAGRGEQRFETSYTYASGAAPDVYHNEATGFSGSLSAGYRFAVPALLGVEVEARLSGSEGAFRLDTVDVYEGTPRGGPASLRYAIPWSAGVAVRPAVRLLGPVALVLEGGAGWGLVEQTKTSATSTRYDRSEWTPWLSVATGLRLATPEATWWVEALYRWTWYASYTLTGAFPDGTAWEALRDEPEHAFFGLRVGRSF